MFRVHFRAEDEGSCESDFPTLPEAQALERKLRRVGLSVEKIEKLPEPSLNGSKVSAPVGSIEDENMVLNAISRKFQDPEAYEMPNGFDVPDWEAAGR